MMKDECLQKLIIEMTKGIEHQNNSKVALQSLENQTSFIKCLEGVSPPSYRKFFPLSLNSG